MLFVVAYLLKNDPALIERRFKLREKRKAQKKIIDWTRLWFLLCFLIPGLDYRFGWSRVPVEVAVAADVLVFAGYALNFLVLRENSYASRVVEFVKGQKLVSTGPYAVVRHPMYSACLLVFLSTPVALGSWVGLIWLLPLPFILAFRALDEEKMLRAKMRGYKAYCKRVRYRFVPFVW
jgi:protein-S-isoprenylcysteine O-methyltransferase Ste14